jgi:hypothetical protein
MYKVKRLEKYHLSNARTVEVFPVTMSCQCNPRFQAFGAPLTESCCCSFSVSTSKMELT